jgi:phosphatidylserine synthase
MSSFTDLEQAWQRQPAPGNTRPQPDQVLQLADQQTKQIRNKHRWTIGILSLTVAIVAWYFILYAKFSMNRFSIGLLLMIASLLIRIFIEYISFRKLQQIDIRSDFKTYIGKVTNFYSKRRVIHLLITPLIYAIYIIGFVLLLPVFQEQFSEAFYIYVLVSGFGSLAILAVVIFRSNRKELELLKRLKRSGEE